VYLLLYTFLCEYQSIIRVLTVKKRIDITILTPLKIYYCITILIRSNVTEAHWAFNLLQKFFHSILPIFGIYDTRYWKSGDTDAAPCKRKFLNYALYIFPTHEGSNLFSLFPLPAGHHKHHPPSPPRRSEKVRECEAVSESETSRESRALVSASWEQITAIASVSWQCNSFTLPISAFSFL